MSGMAELLRSPFGGKEHARNLLAGGALLLPSAVFLAVLLLTVVGPVLAAPFLAFYVASVALRLFSGVYPGQEGDWD